MTNIEPRHSQGPVGYGPTSFTELFLSMFALGAIVAALWLLVHLFFHVPLLLASVGTLLRGVVAGPGSSELLASLGLGVVAGIVVGAVRLRHTSLVLDELVGAVLSPETFTAATVRWSAAAFSVAIGVGSGLVVARLGIVGVEAEVASVVGPLLSGGCFWGCPPGSGSGDLTVTLFAIALIVVALTVLWSIGAAGLFAAVGKGLASGGAQGAGKAIGLALVLFLTRLRTTGLTDIASRSKPGKLTAEAACASFIESTSVGPNAVERRRIVEPYLAWLRERGISQGAGTLGDVHAYSAQSARTKELEKQKAMTAGLARNRNEPGWNEQKHLRVPRGIARSAAELEIEVLRALIDKVPSMVRERDPVNRMTTTDGAPVFDGSNATLFHSDWFRRSLLAGIREGAIVGMVSAVLTVGLLLVAR
jgi:hypothetical protein